MRGVSALALRLRSFCQGLISTQLCVFLIAVRRLCYGQRRSRLGCDVSAQISTFLWRTRRLDSPFQLALPFYGTTTALAHKCADHTEQAVRRRSLRKRCSMSAEPRSLVRYGSKEPADDPMESDTPLTIVDKTGNSTLSSKVPSFSE